MKSASENYISELLVACLQAMGAGDQQFVEERSAYPRIFDARWKEPDSVVNTIMQHLPEVRRDTAESFYRSNLQRTPLPLQPDTLPGIRIVTEPEVGNVVQQLTSMDWFSVYPAGTNGLMSQSHPGINSDFNQGLVCGMMYDGPEAAYGALYSFQRRDGVWHEAARAFSWLS